jgi:hypothetical protein
LIQPATATLLPASPLTIHDADTPASAALAEVARETVLAERAERSFIDRLASMENAAVIFERRAQLIESCYLIALKRTRPQDWVLFKMPDGSMNGMLKASGADLVAEVYGVQVENLRPIDAAGIFKPERLSYSSGAYALRGTCDVWSAVNGRRIYNLEAARRSDEDFTGRTVDAEGRLTHDKEKRVEALDTDLRSSVLTLIRTKGVRIVCGMTRVPSTDLERAWKGSEKTLEQCAKGHGFGTSSGRTASALAPEDVKTEVEKLRIEILKAVGGDVSGAKKLTKEITSGPNFQGFDTVDRITKPFQVDQAWANLKKHPLFGAASGKANGKAAEREPGADGK